MKDRMRDMDKGAEATSAQGAGVPNIVETDAKVPSADAQSNYKAPSNSGVTGEIHERNLDHEKTKTTKAAEVVTASTTPGSAAGTLMRGVSFGGGAGNDVAGDVSATTKADNVYRSGSRTGRRKDPITRKIDFNYPEQVSVEITQSKPLNETSEKQGYNGNYFDEHAIVQKTSGGAPADPLFNRSVDLITMDMAYFADGQYNVEKGTQLGEYAAANWDGDEYDSTVTTTRGSYMPKDLTVTFNANGAVGLAWSEDDLSNKDLDRETTLMAGSAALRSANQLELDRLNLIDIAGNESDPKWCPLGDAVRTATAVNSILRDVDTLAGNNIYMSERKLAEALAYQVNKAAKDGIRLTGPMAEMVNGNIEGAYSSAISPVSESNGVNYALHTSSAFANGSAGLWLAINDSLPKYTTKGKLLTLPLSFKNALNIAKANDAEFRVSDEFRKDVEHCELYSTIDKEYDPFLPVVMTDKANVINSMSLADTGTVTITSSTVLSDNKLTPIFTYHYENYRNRYDIPVYNFFVKGLLKYFQTNASRFREKLPAAVDGIQTLVIPIQSSATSLSLWDLIVCSAVPFMVPERQLAMVDVIKHQQNFSYPYTGSSAIREIDVDYALNYRFIDTESGLETHIANPVDAIKVKFPEVFWSVSCSASDDHVCGGGHGFMVANTVLPYYFNQAQFAERDPSSKDFTLVNGNNPNVMSYPSTRSGVRLTDMDSVYGMSEEDFRLSLDRMVVYPGYDRIKSITDVTTSGSNVVFYDWSTEGTNHYEARPALTYKYGMTGDGIPVIPYLATAETPTNKTAGGVTDASRCLTILDVMKTPRELGLHFVVPSGVLTPVRNASTGYANFRNTSSGYLAVSGPGFTAWNWKVAGVAMEDDILSDMNYSISRSATYAADYVVSNCTPDNADYDFGFVYTIAKGMKATATNHTYTLDGGSFDFVPFVTGSYSGESYNATDGYYSTAEEQATASSGDLNVISFQKYLWTRLQRLPFVINPFDANASSLAYTESGSDHGNKYDIFDFLYMFGLCGFRASDYQELAFERTRDRIAYGMNFINDPYIEKSLLLK